MLLDASTIVLAVDLIRNRNLTAQSLHCLSTLIDAIVLSDQIITCRPYGRASAEMLDEAIGELPDGLIEVKSLHIESTINWDHVHAQGLVEDQGYSNTKTRHYVMRNKVDPRRIVRHDLDALLTNSTYMSALANIRGSNAIYEDDALLHEWYSIDSPFKYYLESKIERVGKLACIEATRLLVYFRLMLHLQLPYRPEFYRMKLFRTASNGINAKFTSIAKQLTTKVDTQSSKRRAGFTSMLGGAEDFELRVPALVAVVMSTSDGANHIMESAIALRNNRKTQRFRRHCGELEGLLSSGSNPKRLMRELRNDSVILSKSFGVAELVNEFTTIPSASYSLTDGLSSGIDLKSLVVSGTRAVVSALKRRHLTFLNHIAKASEGIRNLNQITEQCFKKRLSDEESLHFVEVTSLP